MSDVSYAGFRDFVQQQQDNAVRRALPTEDDDPERAKRAVELSQASGLDSSLIYGDLDNTESQFRAGLTAQIIRRNPHLQSYANSHPMAPKLSADDWGNLDEASQAINKLPEKSIMTKMLDWFKLSDDEKLYENDRRLFEAIEQGFAQGFGSEGIGSWISQKEEFAKTPQGRINYALLSAVGLPLEASFRTFNALVGAGTEGIRESLRQQGVEESNAQKLANETSLMLQLGLMHAGSSMAHVPPELNAIASHAQKSAKALKPYLDAGVEPPIGVDRAVDQLRGAQAKIDMDNLIEALRQAQKSNTRNRDPEMFANFVRQGTNPEIGISSEAVRKLYGDTTPMPDDGLLGWVPGIEEQLLRTAPTGGDIKVPLSEWLAHMEPEVARELREFTRVRAGGLTLEEAKTIKPVEVDEEIFQPREQPPPIPVEDQQAADLQARFHQRPDVPDETANTVKVVRDSAGLGPSITMKRVSQGTGRWSHVHDFDFVDKEGKKVGDIQVSYYKDTKDIYVEYVRAEGSIWSAGPAMIYEGLKQLREAFPEAKTITGVRVSGAREKVAMDKAAAEGKAFPESIGERVTRPLDRFSQVHDLFYDLADRREGKGITATEGDWVELGDGLKVQLAHSFTEKEQEIVAAVDKVVKKQAPRLVDVGVMRKIQDRETQPYAVFQARQSRIPFILWALESPDQVGSIRHEIIHHLRRTGFMSRDEWSELRMAAMENDWIKEYNIAKRYPKAGAGLMIEEAVAEAFAHWNRKEYKKPLPTGVEAVFNKMKQLYYSIRESIRSVLGKEPDFKDIFAKIEKGEVGSRRGVEPLEQGAYRGPTYQKPDIDEVMADIQEAIGSFHTTDMAIRKKQVEALDKQFPDHGVKAMAAESLDLFQTKGRLYQRPEEPELPGLTRLEDRDLFEKAAFHGMTVKMFKQYTAAIEAQDKADTEFAAKQNLKEITRRQTDEWKQAAAKVRAEVKGSLEQRPDLAADKLLREGVLYDQKLKGRPRLDTDALTADQKKSIPADYYSKGGHHPDDVAALFGYHSGDELVNDLATLHSARKATGLSPARYHTQLVNSEVERRMQAEHGDLAKNILDEAQEHVLSGTQFDLLHQEILRLGTQLGMEMTLTKEDMVRMAKEGFANMRQTTVEEHLRNSLRANELTERALLEGDAKEALRQKQMATMSFLYAREAKAFEKVAAKFNRLSEKYGARTPSGVEMDYANHIHALLMRFGVPVKRTARDLLAEMEGIGQEKDLQKFIEEKNGLFGNLQVDDRLYDPAFNKPVKEMTPEEFSAVTEAISVLDKAARDARKVIKEGDKADLEDLVSQMRDQFKEQGGIRRRSLTKPRGEGAIELARYYLTTGMLNAETWLNRWDRDNVRGLFNQWLIRPLSESANREARLGREYSRKYLELGEIKDGDKKVRSPFIDPLSITEENPNGEPLMNFTRHNIAAMISNAGNEYNWDVLTKGYGADANMTMNWLIQNSTKADWVRAEKLGKLFNEAFELAQNVYRNLYGQAPPKIELKPFHITFPNGETFISDGWYHPIIRDRDATNMIRKARGEELLERDKGMFPSIANGYTKRRTGKVDVLSLNYDEIPSRLSQVLHDASFRAEVVEAAKIVKDQKFRNAVRQYKGANYVEMLDNWLADIAGATNSQMDLPLVTRASNYVRTNTIGTLIGFNPYTVMKHGPTAAVNSVYEVGLRNFASAVKEVTASRFRQAVDVLFRGDLDAASRAHEFIDKNSEEIQRRDRNWQETLGGAQKVVTGSPTWRERMIYYGSKPVAFSDMVSARPTWYAAYLKEFEATGDHGQSVFAGDRAVRRAHGSTAITNLPELVRRSGPFGSWLTTLYGFFSTQMQRRAEIAFHFNDAWKLGREGEIKAATKTMGRALPLIFATAIWPTIVEEYVNSIGSDDRRGPLTHLAYGALGGMASSFLYMRDMAHGLVTGQEPSVGMASTVTHAFGNVLKDIAHPVKAFSREHAAKSVQDFLTTFGIATGLMPAQIAKGARFGLGNLLGTEHPKSTEDYLLGMGRGTSKRRIVR